MQEPYYKTSEITGRKYDLFAVIRILNIKQVIHYLNKKVPLMDIEISEDRKTGAPVLVFLFNREDTRDAFDEWCKQKDELRYENNRT